MDDGDLLYLRLQQGCGVVSVIQEKITNEEIYPVKLWLRSQSLQSPGTAHHH